MYKIELVEYHKRKSEKETEKSMWPEYTELLTIRYEKH
jgi:hypothetical protein